MKTFLFITKITINGNLNIAFYNDYYSALSNATVYVSEADSIEIEIQSCEEGKNYYTFDNYTKIKTEKELEIR